MTAVSELLGNGWQLVCCNVTRPACLWAKGASDSCSALCAVLGAIYGLQYKEPQLSQGTIVGISCAIIILLFAAQVRLPSISPPCVPCNPCLLRVLTWCRVCTEIRYHETGIVSR